jgi:hypothetical protein
MGSHFGELESYADLRDDAAHRNKSSEWLCARLDFHLAPRV